jgi:hypothetical protein
MIEIPYSKSRLERCFWFKDYYFGKVIANAGREQILAEDTFKRIQADSIFQNPLKHIEINGKPACQFNDIQPELASRLISKNIIRNYRKKQQDRHNIIANLTAFLSEETPYTVHRLDIKSFYESIDRKELIEKLIEDQKVSWKTINLIESLFKSFDFNGIDGLPRGLSISSVLSNTFLDDFDKKISSIEEVFFYARFVDDIVIVSSNNLIEETLLDISNSVIPYCLDFHGSGKKTHIHIKKASTTEQKETFEYLGYKFTIHNYKTPFIGGLRSKRKVDIDISDEKARKIKKRLVKSYVKYLSSSKNRAELLLLQNRIRALSGNYSINDPKTKIKIKTGIYFNYAYKNYFENCNLDKLDAFSRNILFGKKDPLSKRVSKHLSIRERKKLAGYSFKGGFILTRYHAFSYKTLKEIKEGWN